MSQIVWKQMRCPNCGKRAFDVSHLPTEHTAVEIKCPQCSTFVSVELRQEAMLHTLPIKSKARKRYRPNPTV